MLHDPPERTPWPLGWEPLAWRFADQITTDFNMNFNYCLGKCLYKCFRTGKATYNDGIHQFQDMLSKATCNDGISISRDAIKGYINNYGIPQY